jgi:hypothetical protein
MNRPDDRARPQSQAGDQARPVAVLSSALTLAVCGVGSAMVFHLNHADYVRWYIKNGSVVALVMSIVSLTVELDSMPGLISARVDIFVRTGLRLIALPWVAWLPALVPSSFSRLYMPAPTSSWTGTEGEGLTDGEGQRASVPHQHPASARRLLLVAGRDSDEVLYRLYVMGAYEENDGRPQFAVVGGPWKNFQVLTGSSAWVTDVGELRLTVTDRDGGEHVVVPDFSAPALPFVPGPGRRASLGQLLGNLAAMPVVAVLVAVVMAAVLTWFVVLAPLQYLTFLVCGAPVRVIQGQELTAVYDPAANRVQAHWTGRPVPENVAEAQLRRRPVTTTLAVSSLILWLLSVLL